MSPGNRTRADRNDYVYLGQPKNMSSDSSGGKFRSFVGRFRSQRTRLRVSACVAASRSIAVPDDDATADDHV
ncbi:hypothetical protein GCM10007209_35340 [Haloferax sulfurifontis]|uniref:Uncharacterized protein n=1 Tax=Haloferax sulfurifontis TaxID=255616 RepID=A0A830ECR5_9EURY|nr:hypothetical protein GCM10007209_35340 [Haloferax sulfurifontis]